MPVSAWYGDDFHSTYATSPVSRPLSVAVEPGEAGEVPADAIANLRKKRLPWEVPAELVSLDYDFLRGGVQFPGGVYRFTLENTLVYPQAVWDANVDFVYPSLVWIWIAHSRGTFYEVQAGHADWSVAPFAPYNDGDLQASSTRLASYMAAMDDETRWESNGLDVVLRFSGAAKVLAIVARLGLYQKVATPYDLNAIGDVNPLALRVPSDNDRIYLFANDNAH